MSTTFKNVASLDVGFLLDGKWHTDGEPVEIYSPGTGQLVGVTYRASSSQAEAAIAAAVRAFELTRKLGGYQRQGILRAIALGIARSLDGWSLGHRAAISTWPDRGDYALQFSDEPGRTQAGTGDRGWLHHRP